MTTRVAVRRTQFIPAGGVSIRDEKGITAPETTAEPTVARADIRPGIAGVERYLFSSVPGHVRAILRNQELNKAQKAVRIGEALAPPAIFGTLVFVTTGSAAIALLLGALQGYFMGGTVIVEGGAERYTGMSRRDDTRRQG